MPRDTFQIVADSVTGHGLSFDVGSLGVPADKLRALVDMANVIYKQGRESALFSFDDRFDLHAAAEALRSLGTILGPSPTGDRYRRCADILVRLLQDQEQGA